LLLDFQDFLDSLRQIRSLTCDWKMEDSSFRHLEFSIELREDFNLENARNWKKGEKAKGISALPLNFVKLNFQNIWLGC